MKQPVFSERFAYALWIAHLVRGETPTYTLIAEAVGKTQPWVTKWAKSDEPPTDYRVHEPLATFFGASIDWLIKASGEPPRPDLWDVWMEERRKRRGAQLERRDVPVSRAADRRRNTGA